jgi:hypothetical protein
MRVLSRSIAAVVTAALGVGCDEPVRPDDLFDTEAVDLWCGGLLCDWKLVRGAIASTTTWHVGDTGVALFGETVLEQVTYGPFIPACFRFDMLANVAAAGDLQLKLDVLADGTAEHTFDVPRGAWAPVAFTFAIKAPITSVRFQIVANAELSRIARMRTARLYEGCDGIEPLDGGPAPIGGLCGTNADCATSLCAAHAFGFDVCSACDPSQPACPGGQVCGLADPRPTQRYIGYTCVEPGQRLLAEICVADGECASGLCEGGVCSSCATSADCGGLDCSRGSFGEPARCAAGQRRGEPGAPCYLESDCASARCRGLLRRECSDGRACTLDADCPEDIPRYASECMTTGVQGGVCD